MENYNSEAIEFLNNNNIKLTITPAQKTIAEITDRTKDIFAGETSKHDKYRFTITNKTTGQRYSSIFWTSINDTQQGITPVAYDILSCLSVDYSEDFEDFCNCFGYEQYTENKHGRLVRNAAAYRIYKAEQKQSAGLQRLFNDEQLEQLHEIA